MKLGSLFGSGAKPLATKKITPTATPGGNKSLADLLPKKKKPGDFGVIWSKVKPQQVKDYKAILTREDLIAYLARCEETGLAGFDWETAASQDTRDRYEEDVLQLERALDGAAIDQKEYDALLKPIREKYLKSPLDPHKGDICTVSLSAAAHESRVVPISHKEGKVFEPMLSRKEARKVVMDILDRHLFRKENVVKIAVNLAFETKYAAKYGKYILGRVADPLIQWVRVLQLVAPHKLKNPKKPYTGWGLKPATKEIFGVVMNDFMTLLEKYKVDFFDEIDASQGDGLLYSAEDSDYAVQHYLYWDEMAKQITLPADCPNKNYSEWLHNVEMPFTRVIGLMEYHGMKWNGDQAEVLRQTAQIGQEQAADKIRNIVKVAVGADIDPGKTGKTKAVKEVLFEKMRVPTAGFGATGPSLDAEALLDIKFMLENNLQNLDEEKYLAVQLPENWESIDEEADPHLGKDERMAIRIKKRLPHRYKKEALEMLEAMGDIQKYTTLLSSHVDGREKYVNEVTGRIHASYGPWTETSRLMSEKPNGQNVPRPANDKLGIRGLYQPAEGKVLFFIDFSGFELRIMAWRAKDDVMIELFRTGGDMHRRTASVLAEKSEAEVTKDERTNAKAGNFGISYGGTEHALQKVYKTDYGMRKTLDFCLQVVNAVKKAYEGIPRFQREVALQAREDGWVSTALGYIRMLPDINSPNRSARNGAERQAANTPIQGSAADFMKVAQNEVYDEIGRGTNVRYDFLESKPHGLDEADHYEFHLLKKDYPLAHGETDMIAQIHDEMIFEMDDDVAIVEAAGNWVKATMEKEPLPGFPVPIEAEASVGYQWNKKVSVEEWKTGKGA